MTFSRAFSKRDANHNAVADALRLAGYSVVDLYMVGSGCPDMLVGRDGATWLLEVKNPDAERFSSKDLAPSKDSLRYVRLLDDEQIEWLSKWKGCRVHIVTTPEEALAAVGAASHDAGGAVSTINTPPGGGR